MVKRISVQIASATPAQARELLEGAIAYSDRMESNEDGHLLMGSEPNSGCAMVYVWPPKLDWTEPK